jgi:Peptidase family M28
MKRILLIAIFGISFVSVFAQQDETAKKYGAQITSTDLKEYLSIIGSDAMEGRETGKRGQKMAAAFIASHFQEIGLMPPVNGGYYQTVELYISHVSDAYVKVGENKYNSSTELLYIGSTDTGGELQGDIIFAGSGSEDDLKQVDVKDKVVLILVPKLKGSLSSFRALSRSVREKGAKILYIVSEDTPEEFRAFAEQIKRNFSGGGLSVKKPDANVANKGIFVITPAIAEKIFKTTLDKLKKAAVDPEKKSLAKIKPAKVSYQVSTEITTLKTENVLGYLEGSDKKDEVILVTAHYDHIGIENEGTDHVNNGADDDGSGTVSVMEIAKTFAQAKKDGHGPHRSMVFMTVVGEEKGLLGSEYYVEHPVYPLANTVVDLNIDMVGRTDPEHKADNNYVYVIGSDKLSTELHQLSEKTNKDYTQLKFDYTYNDENHPTNLYKRSDHWNFAKNGIPIIFYFDGIHEDYHKPSDEVSKIEFDLLTKRAQLVFYTAWEIANRTNRIVADKK